MTDMDEVCYIDTSKNSQEKIAELCLMTSSLGMRYVILVGCAHETSAKATQVYLNNAGVTASLVMRWKQRITTFHRESVSHFYLDLQPNNAEP